MRQCLVIVSFLFFASPAIAATSQYGIVIDAGSTGSRLYLYEYTVENNLPVIHEKLAESTKPGLSSYANNPEAAGESLRMLLDHAAATLKYAHIDPKQVPLTLLGTGGMRLLSEATQAAIYQAVSDYLQIHFHFPVHQIETLSGQKEGLYGWLAVNYLDNQFKDDDTVGSIDVGGASTQIAYATDDTHQSADEVTLKIGQKTYTVFAKSFLGLGLDQALNAMNQDKNAATCYPTNYPLGKAVGEFNFGTCESIYNQQIQQHQVSTTLPSIGDQDFIAYSGAYYTFHFFAIDTAPNDTNLEKSIHYICTSSWDQLQQDYPNEAPKYLANYCANGAFLDDLLYHAYQLQPTQLSVVAKINNQDINWALGALFFQITDALAHTPPPTATTQSSGTTPLPATPDAAATADTSMDVEIN